MTFMKSWSVLLTLCLACVAGCDRDENDGAAAPRRAEARSTDPASADVAPATRSASAPRIVFLGDSLTAGYGLEAGEAFPARIEQMFRDEGVAAEVVNAGVSGDTTAGGVSRLDWILRQAPDVVVVGLGGNDGLRGLALKSSEENLRTIIRRSRAAGAEVLLLGMLIPPNYGPEYTAQFRDLYPRLAREMGVPLVPFLLEGVGGVLRLNQGDGIHPTADGHRRVAENVVPHLRAILRDGEGSEFGVQGSGKDKDNGAQSSES